MLGRKPNATNPHRAPNRAAYKPVLLEAIVTEVPSNGAMSRHSTTSRLGTLPVPAKTAMSSIRVTSSSSSIPVKKVPDSQVLLPIRSTRPLVMESVSTTGIMASLSESRKESMRYASFPQYSLSQEEKEALALIRSAIHLQFYEKAQSLLDKWLLKNIVTTDPDFTRSIESKREAPSVPKSSTRKGAF